MSLQDDILRKLGLLDDVPDEFINAVKSLSPSWADELEVLISELSIVDGRIVQDADNLVRIGKIKDQFLTNITQDKSVYNEAIKSYAEKFLEQKNLNDSIFGQTFKGFDIDEDFLQASFSQSRLNAIKLFDSDSIAREFVDPIGNLLSQSVTTGSSFNDMVKTLREFVAGDPERLGQYERYVSTYAKDAFSTFDRSYTQTLVKEYGEPEWVRYLGGKVRDSRLFCVDRDGMFFHIKEVEGWGAGVNVGAAGFPWQGMNKNTNPDTIKTLCGGYNCNHSLVYVIEDAVPEEVIERARESGFIR